MMIGRSVDLLREHDSVTLLAAMAMAGEIASFGHSGARKIGGKPGTALHESGHAVTCFLISLPFHEVSIIADAESSGRVVFDKQWYLAHLRDLRERKVSPKPDSSDIDALASAREEKGFDFDRSWNLARQILRDYWPLVDLLAWTLQYRSTLSGRQVRRLLCKTGKKRLRRSLAGEERERREAIAAA